MTHDSCYLKILPEIMPRMLTNDHVYWAWEAINPFLPITVEQMSYLLQAIEIWILVYDVQAFTDHMATLQAFKGQNRPQTLKWATE